MSTAPRQSDFVTAPIQEPDEYEISLAQMEFQLQDGIRTARRLGFSRSEIMEIINMELEQ